MGHSPLRCRTTSPRVFRALRDGLGAWQVVREGVIVEEKFLDLRKRSFCPPNFVNDVTDAARAVSVTADRLRPEAKRAA